MRSFLLKCLSLLLMCVSTSLSLGASGLDLSEAKKAVRLQQFEQAARLYQAAADQGDGEAQYQLASLYLLGRGLKQNPEQALQWLEKAAAQNHPGAQTLLAEQLKPQNPARADTLLKAAAAQNYQPAIKALNVKTKSLVDQTIPLDVQWWGAARNNQIEQLKQLKAEISNIDLADKTGRTALFYAAEANREQAVQWLIQQGANIKHRDQQGLTAAQRSLEAKHGQRTLQLLKAGDDPRQVFSNGDNLLHYALRLKQTEWVTSLIKAGVPINQTNQSGWTPLDLANFLKLNVAVAELKTAGARVGNGWQNSGIQKQNTALVAEQLSGDSVSPAAKAVANNNIDLLAQILKKDPHIINEPLADGTTLLVLALKNKSPKMVDYLLDQGASLNQGALRNQTPLHFAVQLQNLEGLDQLLVRGADITRKNDLKRDALETALAERNSNMASRLARYILNQGDDVAARKAYYAREKWPIDTYILAAAQYQNSEVLQALLPYATKGGAIDHQQRNALWFAAQHTDAELIKQLLAAGVAPAQPNALGLTPLMVAVQQKCLVCARLLLPGNAIDQSSKNGHTALMLAALNKDALIADWLIQNKADLNARNHSGDTALMLAVSASAVEVVELLLKNKANIKRKNRLGFTAMDLALQAGPGMVQLLKKYR